MEYKCKVILRSDSQQQNMSKLNFKKEWAELLMNAVSVGEKDGVECYMVEGNVLQFFTNSCVVRLQKGIVLSVPIACVKMESL